MLSVVRQWVTGSALSLSPGSKADGGRSLRAAAVCERTWVGVSSMGPNRHLPSPPPDSCLTVPASQHQQGLPAQPRGPSCPTSPTHRPASGVGPRLPGPAMLVQRYLVVQGPGTPVLGRESGRLPAMVPAQAWEPAEEPGGAGGTTPCPAHLEGASATRWVPKLSPLRHTFLWPVSAEPSSPGPPAQRPDGQAGVGALLWAFREVPR